MAVDITKELAQGWADDLPSVRVFEDIVDAHREPLVIVTFRQLRILVTLHKDYLISSSDVVIFPGVAVQVER